MNSINFELKEILFSGIEMLDSISFFVKIKV